MSVLRKPGSRPPYHGVYRMPTHRNLYLMRYCFTTTLNPKRSFVKCVPPGTAFRDQTICHLSGEETSALSPSSISSSLYSKSSRPEKNSPTKESTTEYKPSLGLYPLSREPFSTPAYNYSDQNTLSFQLSELVGSSGFPVSAAKSVARK